MSETDKSGPAFPVHPEIRDDESHAGMTRREYFAAKALQALISKATFYDKHEVYGEKVVDIDKFRLDMSASAVAYADALISSLEAES